MNYIEWALQRGAELWRAREEALKKRLSLVPEGTAQKKAAEAQLSEEEAAALLRAREAESADNASDWIRKLLSADGRDGASAAAARGKNDFSLAQEQEVRETESFSLSLERDARRYDGGFLFY